MAPAVLTVDSTADNTSPDGVLTLREAVALVDGTLGRPLTPGEQAQVSGTLGSSDTIQFDLPDDPQTITLTGGELDLTQPVTITGPGSGTLTIDAGGRSRVFTVGQIFSPNLGLVVAISGLTVANGSVAAPNDYGAGLLNFGTLTLSDMAFTGNAAGAHGGGGIYNVGALTVSTSAFSGNSTAGLSDGGAIDNVGSGTLAVSDCSFSGNSASAAGQGGGIANSGTATVSGCTFTGNSAGSDGGGIFNSIGGTLTVSAATFAGNTSGADGGGLHQDGTATVSGSTFSGNSAVSEGGAVDNQGTLGLINCTLDGNSAASDGGGLKTSGPATLVNCTITANRVTTGAGGVFGGGIDDQVAPAVLTNTIVAGNFRGAAPGTTADDIAGAVDPSSAHNLVGTGGSGGLVNGTGQNLVGVADPGLGPLASNGGPTQTVALLAGSPAIDAGADGVLGPPLSLTTDQRGLPRLYSSHVDIGAFELQVPVFTSANHATFTVGSAGTFPVTASGLPAPALSESGDLPDGVTFTDNGNGTATLAGTPAPGTGGIWVFTLTGSNGVSPTFTQTFTLTVGVPPAVSSARTATFTGGSAGNFTVTTTGFPTPSLTEAGALPPGVTFTDNGDGTATLAGTPAAGSNRSYVLTITAHNGSGSDASQTFTLLVQSPPVSPSPPARRPIAARLLAVPISKRQMLLLIEVFVASTGALKHLYVSPFQQPAFKNIQVKVRHGNGAGAPDQVVVTARKGKRTFTAVFPG